MTLQIDIWSDIACPWCYIGKRRFERALADFEHRDDVVVTWHSYQLDPAIPRHYDGTEVDYLVQRKGMAEAQVRQMIGHVAEMLGHARHVFDEAMSALLAGAVLTEKVFAFPGIGDALAQGFTLRDYPILQVVIMMAALIYIIVNLLVDIAYAIIDPRVRTR